MGHALWLVPGSPARERLQDLIRDLAARFRTPAFEPHVTLLAGVQRAEPDAVARTADLARRLGPLHVMLSAVRHRDEYYRCVFVDVEPREGLLAAREAARRAFGDISGEDGGYEPHLSLVYGDLPEAEKEGILGEIDRGLDRTLWIDRLELWWVEGAVQDWHAAGSFPLGVHNEEGRARWGT